MGLGVEKFETLVDKKVNFRQIYMINFDYRAQMKLQYLYNHNDFIKDIELYFCFAVCIAYFAYVFFIKPIYQRVFIWFLSGFDVSRACEI